MKKLIIFLLFGLILSSCSDDKVNDLTSLKNINICKDSYNIGYIDKSNINLKGVIINNDTRIISSPIAGIINELNCDIGAQVEKNTLIATIIPDFENPNIINYNIQKGSLINQKLNLESVKNSTISSFDIQILGLENQISDLKEQIDIIDNNIGLTKKSTNISKSDLEKEISNSEENILNLENSLNLLLKSKEEAINKINISKKTLYGNIKTSINDNLLKIDEIFGITDKNKDLNDKYEDYLSAKNSNLKNIVTDNFRNLNNLFLDFDDLSNEEITKFLSDLIVLNNLSKSAIKESIENIYFTQNQIDTYYNIFLNYELSITTLKDSYDSLENSLLSTNINYDTQIISLENQISTLRNNLENLQTNKIDSIDVGLDLKLSELDSQSRTLKSNLDSQLSNLANLKSTKESQILSLNNQILQIEQSIDSINTNLNSRNIYAEVSGKVKEKFSSNGNNIGLNGTICQIIPDNKSTKIKIYSPIELNINDKLSFKFNKNNYEIIIENEFVYKDPVTQNYIYESNYLDNDYFKNGEIISLSLDETSLEINEDNIESDKQKIVPVSYIKNKIDGNFINILTSSGLIEKEIELGTINGDFIEILSGLENVNNICK